MTFGDRTKDVAIALAFASVEMKDGQVGFVVRTYLLLHSNLRMKMKLDKIGKEVGFQYSSERSMLQLSLNGT